MIIFNGTKAANDFFSKTRTVKGKKTQESICEKPTHKTIGESEAFFDTQFSDGMVRPWQWVVHAIKVSRKTVIIVMDYHSRFSITLTGIKKGDHANFMAQFELHLKTHVWELFASVIDDKQHAQEVIAAYFSTFNQCAFYARSDRSVQAHINDVAWHFSEYYSASPGYFPEGEELLNFDDSVNRLMRKPKGSPDYIYPDNVLLKRTLIEIGQVSASAASDMIDQLQTLKRQEREEHTAQLVDVETKQKEAFDLEYPVHQGNVISLGKYRK